jgi:hypothetical protein
MEGSVLSFLKAEMKGVRHLLSALSRFRGEEF